jgi:hypothetical protein
MNTFKYLKEKDNKDLSYIRSYVYKNFIKTVIEANELDTHRVMFIANRFKSDFSNPISFECNGIIAEYNKKMNTYKALVIPVQLFNSQKLIKTEIERFYTSNQYELYKVHDGTLINLYYYNNSWRISTNKAYDANNLIFVNDKTYEDVLHEIMELYPSFQLKNLDTNKCYTLCFKYEPFHPFIENEFLPVNKLTFIQSVNLPEFNDNNKLIISEDEDIGLPINKKYDLNQFKNLHAVLDYLNNEINRYKHEHHLEMYEPVFGLILRSKNFKTTKNYSNILLESNLMTKIRNLIYNHTFTKKLHFYDVLTKNNGTNLSINKNYYNMLDLISLKVFLTKKDINLFITLFPQYRQVLKNYETIFKYITRYFIKNYNVFQNNMNDFDKILKNQMYLETDKIENLTAIHINYEALNKLLCIICLDLYNKKINLNVNENYDILYDYLNNMLYIDYYYSYFYKHNV